MAPTETKQYDYIVIGGGSGGSGAARRASGWYKKKVALISEGVSGGCCVNVGCVPKKMTWNMASINESLHKSKYYHYDTKDVPFNFSKFVEDRDARIRTLNGAYERNWAKDGIDLIHARATFVSDHELEIKPNDGSESYRLKADHICIATGSYATVPKDIEGAEHGITSDEYFLIKELPKSMVFVGAGYIAVELAGVMAALGVEVHMFLRHESFLRSFDPLIQSSLVEYYEKVMGIKIHRNHPGIKKLELLSAAKSPSDPREKQLKITSNDGSEITVNECLWAIGRGAETRNLGLENTGIKLDDTGHVIVDKYQNTTVDGVAALGDITGRAELTPVAIAAGRTLGNRLFGPEQYKDAFLDYENIPTVIFAHPVVGTTGLTEPEAVKKFGKENVKVYETKFAAMFYDFHPKEEKPPTAYKMIVEGPEERIVGLHLIGDGMDEAMQGFGVAVKMGARKRDFDSTVAIHPTSAEELVTMMPGMAREGRA